MNIRLKDLLYITKPNTSFLIQDKDEDILFMIEAEKIEETAIYKQVYANYSVLEIYPEDFGDGTTCLCIEITKE